MHSSISSSSAPADEYPSGDRWRRHPADVARLVLATSVFLVGALITKLAPEATRNVSADIVRLVSRLPPGVRGFLLGIVQLGAVLVPLALIVMVVFSRRRRLVVVGFAAAVIAAVAVALLQGWLDRTVPPVVFESNDTDSFLLGAAFPSGSFLAAVAAIIVVIGPTVQLLWRRLLWTALALGVVSRVITAVAVPLNLLTTVALGACAGALALVVFGSPERRVGIEQLRTELAKMGMSVDDVTPLFGDPAQQRFGARVGTDSIVIRVVGRDDRDADILSRVVRALRVKGVEDSRPGSSPTAQVQREALSLLLAGAGGSRAPRVLAVGTTDSGDALLATTEVVGTPLADIDPPEIDDSMLAAVWQQLFLLHRQHLAHRALHAHSILIARDATPQATFTDFRWSSAGAADEAERSADIADVLVTLAALVGVDRAVASACASPMDRAALVAALPMVQPLALATVNRRTVPHLKDLTGGIRAELQRRLEVPAVELAEIARISAGSIISVFGIVVMAGVALAFASNASDIADAISDARWSLLPVVLAMIVIGYVASAWSLIGAVPRSLPLVRTTEVMFAQTFLNRFTPANAGGMALRARYLQKFGIDLTGAATSVGLTSAASGVIQVVFLTGLAVWAGSSDAVGFDLPDVSVVALVVLVVLLLGAALYATPWGRRVLVPRLRIVVKDAWTDFRQIATRPTKMLALFGGAAVGKVTAIIAFSTCAQMFDVHLPFAQIGLLYMTAGTVASVAPTPGGVGAIEAALVAVLTGAGVDPAIAFSIVVVYRVLTYWMPVLPCWLALEHLRRTNAV